MNAYLKLTAAQLRLFARNRQVLFWTLFFPIFFMILFGSFLGNGTNQMGTGIIIDQDHSTSSTALIHALEGQPVVKFTEGVSLSKAKKTIRQGDNQFILVIPKDYGNKLTNSNTVDTPAQIQTYYDQTSSMKFQAGQIVINQIVDQTSKAHEHYQPLITVKYTGMQGLHLKYIDFLVPGIVAMMIMSNNLNGVAGQIAAWRERGILRRMQSTPLHASTFIAAQITARLILNGLQALLVLLIGSLFFGTQVNGSWLLLIGFVILGTLAFMAIGFIIAGLAKTPESAGPIAGFISFPMLFLGGVFFPIQNMPKFLQPMVRALPISHLTSAMREVMNVGSGLPTLWPDAVTLGCWLVGAFIVASFTFKWE